MTMTPTELLETAPVQSVDDTARILALHERDGQPNRRAVFDLVRSGAIALVDDTTPIQRWTVSSAEIRRYVSEGAARRHADA